MTRFFATAAKIASINALVLGTITARAADFSFSQSGFTGGGTITGTFSGADLNADGQISSFSGEVKNFSLSFAGDSFVGTFSHGLSSLSGLVYDVGSGSIGDGTAPNIEGLASNWNTGIGYEYASGLGPLGILGGRVLETSTGRTTETAQLIAVSVVPEPPVVLTLLGGIALVLRRSRDDA